MYVRALKPEGVFHYLLLTFTINQSINLVILLLIISSSIIHII
jgi:hypothetical protein